MACKIDVIIPAYNEEEIIDGCLESLVRQSFKDFSVLMIDDASTDSTAQKIRAYAEKYPKMIELKQYGKVGPGRARNLAAKDSGAEILAFMDADCIATENWLEELIKNFAEGGDKVGSGGGPHLAPAGSSDFQLEVEKFFKATSPAIDFYKEVLPSQKKIYDTDHNPLCNVAYLRKVFLEVGGFREDLWPGEDVEIDLQVRSKDYRITFNPQAVVYHHRPESIEQFKRVMFAYGRAQGKLVRMYGLKRGIQWLGLSILLIQALFLLTAILSGDSLAFGLTAGFSIVFFYFRPKWSTKAGIWTNAFDWFNGYVQGLATNRSDPPGKSPVKN